MNVTNQLLSNARVLVSEVLGIGIAEDVLRAACTENGTAVCTFLPITDAAIATVEKALGESVEEGFDPYAVIISDTKVEIYYSSEISKLYAAHKLVSLDDGGLPKGVLYARAICEVRGYKCYLPHKDAIGDFKKQIDLLLLLGYNTLTLELGGGFEYKSHPEINEGWIEYCKIFREHKEKAIWTQRSYKFPKDSIHIEVGENDYLTEEKMREILDYCEARHIEVIPEMPSLSHADYILYAHPEFAEDKEEPLPSFACPSNGDYYKLLFELFDDVIRVFKPKRINVGHDEGYVFGLCDKCKGKTTAELFASDIKKIHQHLTSHGVKTMFWGDKVCSNFHGGGGAYHVKNPALMAINHICGKDYEVHAFKCYSDAQFTEYKKEHPDVEAWRVDETFSCRESLPKDLEIVNWYYSLNDNIEEEYREMGWHSIYGNWQPWSFKNLHARMKKSLIHGASTSNWGSLDHLSMQRAFTYYKLFDVSRSLWDKDYDYTKKIENRLDCARWMFEHFNKETLKKNCIAIEHSCDFDMPHISFDCGYWIENEEFHIGDYKITFEDGSEMIYPIIWGENIGPSFSCAGAAADDGNAAPMSIMEAAGTALVHLDEKENISYRILIPTEKNVKSIILEKTEKCIGDIIFRHEAYSGK